MSSALNVCGESGSKPVEKVITIYATEGTTSHESRFDTNYLYFGSGLAHVDSIDRFPGTVSFLQ